MHSSGGELVAVNYMIYTRLEDEAMLLKENVASQPQRSVPLFILPERPPAPFSGGTYGTYIYIGSIPLTNICDGWTSDHR
jgi:hypothetical protein